MTHFGLSLKREKCAGSCKQPKVPRPARAPLGLLGLLGPLGPLDLPTFKDAAGFRADSIRETRSASSLADLLNLK